MKALFIIDKDAKTELSEDLRIKVLDSIREKRHDVETVELERDEVAPCLGCLLCLTKHLDECVSKDTVNEIKRKSQQYGMTIFLTPVIFGHFSSTIANALARGAGSHNLQVIIGYGTDIDEEEKSTFIDLIAKHRGKADIVHPGMDRRIEVFVSRSFEDNAGICEALSHMLE